MEHYAAWVSEAAIWIGSMGVSAAQILILLGLIYYYLLLIASLLPPRRSHPQNELQASFAVAIPAHNEEAVIRETVESLFVQNYPRELFDVYVAADHCTDRTAEMARESGAICFERLDEPHGRKAYPLRWLFEHILSSEKAYDAIVVFDADSRVHAGFLHAMNKELASGKTVLQGKHIVANASQSAFSRLADVDLRLNNLLRNKARSSLGLSARLMGDAMCFRVDIVQQHGWPVDSLAEDRGFGLYLLGQGIRTAFVPEAMSFGQAALGWQSGSKQRLRWFGGALQIRRRFLPELVRTVLRRFDPAALDQAVELLLPPFSALAMLSFCCAMAQLLFSRLRPLASLPLLLLVSLLWVAFPFLGLLIDKAPASAFFSVLYGPIYLVWRVTLGLKARIMGDRVTWVRTARQEETSRHS